jgi:CelD/BcsL family acetyltransferase involved in cellulose biosynthesis
MMRVEEVATAEGLAALRPAWDALFAEAETASPFNSWVWLATWWDLFGTGKELRVFIVWDGQRAVGIAPFYALAFKVGPLQLRVLMQLGRGNCLTEVLQMLVARGRRAEVVARLAEHLVQRRRGLWDAMIWAGVERAELPPCLARFIRVDDPTDYEVRTLPSTWTELVKNLNKSMRDNVKYYPRLLQRHGHEGQTHFATRPEDMGPALNEFLRLHRTRAEMAATRLHDDHFGRPAHTDFLRRVAPALAAQGMMRVALLAVDGANAAAQITLEHAGTVYIYYSGFDPAWRQYGVGMSVTADCIRDAMERGVQRVNFLRGGGQFKQRWDTQNVPLGKLTFLRDSPLMAAGFVAYRAQRTLLIQRAAVKGVHGISAQTRLLGWIGKALRQPALGE